jgi:hypothetical protein
MVEIFKTNVTNKRVASSLLKSLHQQLPACRFNFDLDDCDRILRAESECLVAEITKIIQIVKEQNIEIRLFED